MMLERFVFRRDDPESFPDDEAAPFTASSSTSQGDPFRVVFLIAEPPAVSRLYVQWPGPGGLDPAIGIACDLVTAHRDLVLLRLNCNPVTLEDSPLPHLQQDYFICRASSSPQQPPPPLLLKRIPMCRKPVLVRVKKGKELTMPRVFHLHTLGLLRRGKEDFAMAQLDVLDNDRSRPTGKLCMLRSRLSDHRWGVMQNLQIHYREEELLDLLYWRTDTVIPFSNFLCWVNYYQGGILFCNVFEEMPKLVYLRLPIADRPRDTSARTSFDTKRSVCVTEAGLKFVDVSREDGELLGPMEPGTGFTITCNTLKISESGDMKWDKDFSITSKDLWACNSSDLLPRSALMYPLVSMDRPHLVHFLLADQSYDGIYNVSTVSIDESRDDEIDKVFSVSIDMSTKAVVSILPYIEGGRDLRGKDADMVDFRSHLLQPFLPSEFPKFLNKSL